MTHIAAALFFGALILASAAIIHLTVREYWHDIVAALKGEVPTRQMSRPWAARARVTSRPRPVTVVRAVKQQRAAV